MFCCPLTEKKLRSNGAFPMLTLHLTGNYKAITMPTAGLPLAAVILTILDVALSAPPQFYKRPEFPSVAIIAGNEVKLECFVISGVNFTMTWTKNNRIVEESPKYPFF